MHSKYYVAASCLCESVFVSGIFHCVLLLAMIYCINRLQVDFILTAKIFEPLTKCLWNLPENLMVYEGTESTDSVTRWTYLGLNKLRGVDCGELAQTLKEDDQPYKVCYKDYKLYNTS